jgi:hypothetical protein
MGHDATEPRDQAREGWPVGLVAALTFVGVLLLILVVLRMDRDRTPLIDRVAERDVVAFEEAIAGALSPVSIRATDRLRLRASRVRWLDDAGRPWVESPTVTVHLRITAMVGGAIVVEDGVVESPRLTLVRRGPDRWNYDEALAPFLDPARAVGPEPSREFRIRNLRIRNGLAVLDLGETTVRATDMDFVLASAIVAGPGLSEPRLHFTRGEANLVLPAAAGEEYSRRLTLADAHLRLPGGSLAFDVARLVLGTSVLTGLTGVWDPDRGGFGIDARAAVERLAITDLPWLRTEVPTDAVATGQVTVRALPGDRTALTVTAMRLRSETSVASGSLRAVIGPEGQLTLEEVDLLADPLALSLVEVFTGPLPYVGELRGTLRGTGEDLALDLRASLGTAPGGERFSVALRGRAALTDLGFELRQLTADLEGVPVQALAPLAPGLPFRGIVTGTVALNGLPGEAPLRLDTRLEIGGGIVTMAGTVDLRGPEPVYDVNGRIIAVELRRVMVPEAPPVQVHASFAMAGRGTDPATARTDFRLDGRFTGWRSVQGDTVVIAARAANGLLVADQFQLELGPVHVAAAGDWSLAEGEGGAIRYSLAVESLEPLAPYLPRPDERPLFARGALVASGLLEGTLQAPVVRGEVRATDFRYGDWSATNLDGRYEARFGSGLPLGTAEITATDLRSPGGAFDTVDLVVDFTRPTFAVRFQGQRLEGQGVVQLEADGRVDDNAITEVVLRTMELDLDRHRWRLPEPARIERTPDGVLQITAFRLEQVDGDGLLSVAGVVAPFDLTDLSMEVVALPAGDLLGLVRPDLGVTGQLWLTGTLSGPEATPTFEADVRLLDGSVRGVPLQHLRAFARYQGRSLSLVGDGMFVDGSSVDLEAFVPLALTLGLPPTVELLAEEPIRGEVRTQDFALAVLDPAIPTVRDLQGLVSAHLVLGGTPLNPVLSGGATLREGTVTIQMLGQRYERIEGEVSLDREILRVDRLIGWSDGSATLQGSVRFEDLVDPVFDLTAELQRFRPQRVAGRPGAAVSGRLSIRGSPAVPVLAGNLLVEDGALDMAMVQPTGRFSDDLIGIAERFDPLGPGDFDLLEPVGTGVLIPRLDLVVANDVWFQSDEFRVQVGGSLIVQKPAEDVMITGTLTGDRGTFNLRIGPATRRFDIVSATIQFFGAPGPDPALDITAARVIPGPNRTDFELRIRLTGTLTAPAVAFSTEDGTSIPEAEALNFLVFGRATATLGDFPGAGFGTTQSLYDALAFYGAFDWVSAAVAEQFGAGIDYFQILVRSGTAEYGAEFSFLLGHEVFDDVFVLVNVPTTEFEARWALTAEWRIDRQWTLEAGYEPPDMVIGIPGRRLPFAVEQDQQFFVSIRRRWTY